MKPREAIALSLFICFGLLCILGAALFIGIIVARLAGPGWGALAIVAVLVIEFVVAIIRLGRYA